MELNAVETEVTTQDNATNISLSCEMSLYLRPDEDLQWFRGGELITGNTEKYTIIYNNGTPLMGQFEGVLGSSRISTLVISEPQMSDSGTYTCAIRNTEHSQDIQLTIESAGMINDSVDAEDPTNEVYPTITNFESTGMTNNSTDPTDEVDPTVTEGSIYSRGPSRSASHFYQQCSSTGQPSCHSNSHSGLYCNNAKK